jgi:hypothetical protein
MISSLMLSFELCVFSRTVKFCIHFHEMSKETSVIYLLPEFFVRLCLNIIGEVMKIC